MENPPSSPSRSSKLVLRHPTLNLELVLQRDSLADLLISLGYTEVVPEAHDLTTLTNSVKEDSDDNPNTE